MSYIDEALDAAYQTDSKYDVYVSYMKEANLFYHNAVGADGELKRKLLKQALDVLALVPDDFPASPRALYPSKKDLESRIISMQ